MLFHEANNNNNKLNIISGIKHVLYCKHTKEKK